MLDVCGLTVEIPTPEGWVRPVDDVSLKIARGESFGLVGESGSGKTMLALALVGLLPAGGRRSGTARLAASNGEGGRDLVAMGEDELRGIRGGEIGFVFQEPASALNPVMRIGAQISEAIRAHRPGSPSEEIERETLEALDRVRVPEPSLRASQFPHQLSGGLRQRAMIAMALAGRPCLLVADEPTTALDATVQKEILSLLAGLRRELGLAMLFITHDLGVVAQVAERVAVMYAGRIVESGPVSEVLRRPLHPYTEALLRASPQLKRHMLRPIPGGVPPLAALPPGCAFAPRCGYRQEECTRAVPDLRAAAPEHAARCILISSQARFPEGSENRFEDRP